STMGYAVVYRSVPVSSSEPGRCWTAQTNDGAHKVTTGRVQRRGPMVTIRPFQQQDLDQCAALYVRVFGETPWNEEWTLDDARKHLQQAIDTPGFEALVAVNGDRIVGVVTGNRKCTSAGEALLLDDMYLDTDVRGQGLGTQMMDELKRRLAGHVSAF